MIRELRGGVTVLAALVTLPLIGASFDFGLPGQSVLQSLRFHNAALLLLAMLGLFALRAWRRGLLVLLVLAVSVGQGAAIIYRQQAARAPLVAAASTPLLRLLSFNALFSNGENGKRLADFVAASGADVVMVMEALPLFEHLPELAGTYPGRIGCATVQDCDLLLLSKTPLDSSSIHNLSRFWPHRLIVATTSIGGNEVNLVAAHLVKPYFDSAAEEEAAVLGTYLERMKGPVVLAGDFNATAWSETIERLAEDNHLVPAPFYPATWPVELGPLGVPIDNVFTRAPLVVQSIRSLDDSMGSNHRGLLSEISLVSQE